MRVILEGCDGVGKTTLAKIIADKYHLDICHCGKSDPVDFDFYYNSMRKDNIVWDRHAIGELVYPSVFGRTQGIGYNSLYEIINNAKQIGVKIFVLTADDDAIKQRLNERGTEEPKILSNICFINDKFKRLAHDLCVPVIDTSKMTLKEIFELLGD